MSLGEHDVVDQIRACICIPTAVQACKTQMSEVHASKFETSSEACKPGGTGNAAECDGPGAGANAAGAAVGSSLGSGQTSTDARLARKRATNRQSQARYRNKQLVRVSGMSLDTTLTVPCPPPPLRLCITCAKACVAGQNLGKCVGLWCSCQYTWHSAPKNTGDSRCRHA